MCGADGLVFRIKLMSLSHMVKGFLRGKSAAVAVLNRERESCGFRDISYIEKIFMFMCNCIHYVYVFIFYALVM